MIIPHAHQHFFFVGYTAPLYMYSSSHIKIYQWFYFFFLLTFFWCPFIFCCCLFYFITRIATTSPFSQTSNTSPPSSKYLLKILICLPTILVSTFGEPRCLISASQSPKPLSINSLFKNSAASINFPSSDVFLHPI